MRACFLGQNVCALGYGVATLQTPPLQDEDTGKPQEAAGEHRKPARRRPGTGVAPQSPQVENR